MKEIITIKKDIIEIQNSNKKNLLLDKLEQKKIFDQLAHETISKIHIYKKIDKYFITTKSNREIIICNYNNLKKTKIFKPFKHKIKEFQLHKISQKIKHKKLIIVGSLAATTIIGFNIYHEINSTDDKGTYSEPLNTTNINIDDNEDIIVLNIDDDDFDIDAKQEDYSLIQSSNILNQSQEMTNQDEYQSNHDIENNNYIDFSILKDFQDYEEYIYFASNLYGVDYDVALKQVKANFAIFTTPCDANIGLYTSELNRMKDLKEKGKIDCDLNVIGIFLTIKDYAIDHMNLTEQKPIISTKTVEEKEKDLIYIAKYIYGVNDNELLNCILAVHRLETGHGTSPAVINKNNFGGNMNPNSSPDNPVLNIYKTAEIGEESMVRNFLNCYGKCFYNETCDKNADIPTFMSNMYCSHTPNQWAKEVIELLNYDNIENDVNKYLNNNNKTM